MSRTARRDVDDQTFAHKLKFVLAQAMTWLVNSAADINKIDWHVSPVHVLVGGNKLDRGFTVEGLTVTYMNRPASPQVDTLEQRARAFGYRGDFLPYCQFFASKKTIRSLTEIVHTEEDLRARLHDHIDSGGSVHTWAREIGLVLPDGHDANTIERRLGPVDDGSGMAPDAHALPRCLATPLTTTDCSGTSGWWMRPGSRRAAWPSALCTSTRSSRWRRCFRQWARPGLQPRLASRRVRRRDRPRLRSSEERHHHADGGRRRSTKATVVW